MNGYTDARELISGYKKSRCPHCGTVEWFKRHKDRYITNHYWICHKCGHRLHNVLEYPCPECDIAMQYGSGSFVCNNKNCDYTRMQVNDDELLARLTSEDYPEVAHKPGIMVGDCPVCGSDHSVNGGPDGELECSECGNFYAGQYTTEWYAYAVWMQSPEKVRVPEVFW